MNPDDMPENLWLQVRSLCPSILDIMLPVMDDAPKTPHRLIPILCFLVELVLPFVFSLFFFFNEKNENPPRSRMEGLMSYNVLTFSYIG